MKSKWLLMVLPCVLGSCQVYQAHFECPPPCGIPCMSVSEIESLIVETSSGPDIFSANDLNSTKNWKSEMAHCRRAADRVWIAPSETIQGNWTEGHYIYLKSSETEAL